jgi:enoyl-CoA hydratase/carnithine racemase
MAVNGIAFTLPIELALAAGIVIAADDVRFRQLEIGRGIMPFGGATFRAPAQLGWGNAMRFLLTAEEYGAAEAMPIGLVQEVVPAGPVVPTARAAKRLVNVYRVLRASKVGRDKLRDPASGEYKVALLLLSLVTGWPHLALPVLRELESNTAKTWPDLLDAVRKKHSERDRTGFERGPGREDENDEILGKFQRAFKDVEAGLDRYRAWAPDISRFSVPANDNVTS